MRAKGASARIDGFYKEAVAALGPPSAHGQIEAVMAMLLANLDGRIKRKVNDPSQPSLTAEANELSRIAATYATLQSPLMAGSRDGDPDAGARAICDILSKARAEFGENVKANPPAPPVEPDPEVVKEVEASVNKTTDARRRLGIRGK